MDGTVSARRLAIVAEVPRMMRYARALLRNKGDAEDLVHDCIVRALANLSGWRDGDNPRNWLFTIMHNIHIDGIRKQARRPTLVPMEDWDDSHGYVSPSTEVIGSEIDQALAALPLEQRQCVLLIGLEGLSYAAAAQVLGIPVGTVMSRLSRGREGMRQRLDPNKERPTLRRVK